MTNEEMKELDAFVKSKERNTLCIDFDGTICQKQSYGDGSIWQEPQAGAKEIINKLAKHYEIVILTTRANGEIMGDVDQKIETVGNWLKKHGILYDRITAIKPMAQAYIDDRGLRFTTWQDMSNYFLQ